MATKTAPLWFPSPRFLLIALIVLQAIIISFPSCIYARKLLSEDNSSSPAGGYGDEKGDDGSKSGVEGSMSTAVTKVSTATTPPDEGYAFPSNGGYNPSPGSGGYQPAPRGYP